MPIVTGKPASGLIVAQPATADTQVNQLTSSPVDYSPTFIDSRSIALESILTEIEGMPWTLNYLCRYKTADTELSGYQRTKDLTFQSYTQIVGLEVRVSSPLTPTQNDDTKTMEYTGSATMYPSIIPCEGDMFIADIGKGKRGLFRVTASEKKSISPNSCYAISFTLNTDNPTVLSEIMAGVIQTYYFRRDFLNYGKNPIISTRENEAFRDLWSCFDRMSRLYSDRFYSKEFTTFIVPDQPAPTYDKFVAEFIRRAFCNDEIACLRDVKILNTGDRAEMQTPSVYTAIIERDSALMEIIFQKAKLLSARAFYSAPVYNSIRVTGIRYAVFPLIGESLKVDNIYFDSASVVSFLDMNPSRQRQGTLNQIVDTIDLAQGGIDAVSTLHEVATSDYYVFSEHFYSKDSQQSVMEKIVWNYLDGKKIDPSLLAQASKNFLRWGLMEQFYFGPILMFLIKAVCQAKA